MATTGTVAGGFVVNGRHLSFGPNPQRQMWVAGPLFNLNTYNAVPSGIGVEVEYVHDAGYGRTATAEIRDLTTRVPVWNGVPAGPVTASLTDLLRADQFYVHALLDGLEPGQSYHYRFTYTKNGEREHTPDATFSTAPDGRGSLAPFTFTALDVVPAAPDGTATMTVRAINEQGVEFDRVVFSRDTRSRAPRKQ